MSLRTLIVDDEPLARRGLELRLRKHADVEIVGEAANGREAFHAISSLRPELMFLDVQMPGVDGFELLRAVPVSMLPMTVFVTAYDQYALAAFAASALDYLLKPVDDIQRQFLMETQPKVFFVTDHYRGSDAILVSLSKVRASELRDLIEGCWRSLASKKMLTARDSDASDREVAAATTAARRNTTR